MGIRNINSLLIIDAQEVVTTTGENNDVFLDSTSVRVMTTNEGDSITGLSLPVVDGGAFLWLVNASATKHLILKHNDSSSAAGNRIFTINSKDLTLAPYEHIFLRYVEVSGRTGWWTFTNPSPEKVKMKSGMAYHAPMYALYTAALADGALQASPVFVPETTSFNQISIQVTTAGGTGSVIRLGIYNADQYGLPTTLVADAGTVDATTTGAKTIAISQTLETGWYCLAAVAQGTPTPDPIIRMSNSLNNIPQPTDAAYVRTVFTEYGVAGALPSTFTASPGIDSGDQPFIQLKVA